MIGDDAFDLTQELESERTILTLHVGINMLEEEGHSEEVNDPNPFLFPEEDEQIMADFDDIESSYNNVMITP